MTTIKEPVQILSARLPELVWKLNTIHPVLNQKSLPPGLFIEQLEMTPQSCIDEIKEDLRRLNAHKNERIAHYLADRVNKKINVLVRLCQIRKEKRPQGQSVVFGVQAISTRQQWLSTLEGDIEKLSIQQQALTETLNKLLIRDDTNALLNLQAEIGEVERRLTLAKETLARAISA